MPICHMRAREMVTSLNERIKHMQHALNESSLKMTPNIYKLLNSDLITIESKTSLRHRTLQAMMNSPKAIVDMTQDEIEKFEYKLIETVFSLAQEINKSD